MDFIGETIKKKSIYNPAIYNVPTEGIDTSVDLQSGQIMLGVGDISNGEGISTMSISHIYNGEVTSDTVYGNIHTHMGVGFKLNIQQYLIQKDNEYIYLDAEGGKHRIEENHGVYYDTSGLGLIMTEEGSRRILTDSQGNQLVFDGYGKLIKSKGVFGNEIDYIYDGDKLVKMQHTLDKSRSFSFAYEGNTLVGIRCDMTGKEVVLSYEEGKDGAKLLENISIHSKGQWGSICGFSYDDKNNNKMSFVSLGSSRKVLAITYNGDKKVENIREALVNISKTWSKSFKYSIGQTEVTDEKGIKLQYSYKEDGEIYSIVEVNKYNVITPIYPQVNTLGTKFFRFANESDRNVFNSYNIQILQRDAINENKSLILDYDENKINEINAMQLATMTFSGWVKIATQCNAWLVAKYKEDKIGTQKEIEVKIDTTLNGWQYVSAEIIAEHLKNDDNEAENNNIIIIDIYLKIGKTENNTGYGIEVSDIRFLAPNKPRAYVISNRNDEILVDDITKIKAYKGTKEITTINKGNGIEITGEDLEKTLRDSFIKRNTGDFNLTYDRGRKIIGDIDEVKIYNSKNESMSLRYDLAQIHYKYAVSQEVNIHTNDENNTTVNKIYTYDESHTYESNDNKILRTVKTNTKNIGSESNNEDLTTTMQERYNIKGLLLSKTDESGMKYNYT